LLARIIATATDVEIQKHGRKKKQFMLVVKSSQKCSSLTRNVQLLVKQELGKQASKQARTKPNEPRKHKQSAASKKKEVIKGKRSIKT